jgi:hypothetical protein
MWVRDEGVRKLSLKCEKVEQISEKGELNVRNVNFETVDVDSEKVTIKVRKLS